MVRGLAQPPPDPPMEYVGGWEKEWYPDGFWRVLKPGEADGRKCRRAGCLRPPVAACRRTAFYASGRRHVDWLYCDWHLYGRKIEGGAVLALRVKRDKHGAPVSAPRGSA